MTLYLARKHGRTIAHNLLPLEVLDLRLSDHGGNIEILEQPGPHPEPVSNVAFCPHCARVAGEAYEAEIARHAAAMQLGRFAP
jgi:hypothetical protein